MIPITPNTPPHDFPRFPLGRVVMTANAARTIDKVPGIGQIPVLGELFKSRAFQANRTDLVVFVTPYVIDANSKRNLDLIKRSDQLRDDFRNNTGPDIVN